MKIGILALQGAFIEHKAMLDKLGIDSFEIRQLKDIEQDFDGLILPGGESSVMGRLLRDLELFDPLREKIKNGLPVFGTCAGMILLAKEMDNDERRHFSCMDITVKRNAYGRQLGSFVTKDKFEGIGDVEMVFIRAPFVSEVKEGVDILSIVNDNIVAVRQKNMLATSYHPELTNDLSVHKYFIKMVEENARN